MKTRISKAYRGQKHVGWKKTVGNREWFLRSGTSAADEAKAIRLAQALEAKWQLAKIGGAEALTETDFNEARELVEGRQFPQRSAIMAFPPSRIDVASEAKSADTEPAVAPVQPVISVGPPRRWLHSSLDEFIGTVKRSLKPDMSNGDHVVNTCDRVLRAREAIADIPLDLMRRKEIDDWLLAIRALRNKKNGEPLGATTIRNIVAGVRTPMSKFAEWEWWLPPPLWEKAFKGYTIKKLQTPDERKARKKRPPVHSLLEKRILWHLALPYDKAMMAMADWAGHTQKENATLTFDEIKDENGEMFIDRDRNKTGVPGRWWIPPEPAAAIRRIVARTPRDKKINPQGLVFLTPDHMPLVHSANTEKLTRSDYVGGCIWSRLLRAATAYGVRWISYKFMRKGTAQMIRDAVGSEVSRTFLA
jgi:hypothetical protein